jgi:hypothetical protein
MSKVIKIATIIYILIFVIGCYSFKGGSVPEHLKTINILSVEDNSGYGNPNFKITLTDNLIDEFQNDNSLNVVNNSGDAELKITISRITEESSSVSEAELESRRKITVNCDAVYYDNVKRNEIWKKSFSAYDFFDIAAISTEKDAAVNNALEQLAEEILFAVVSGW